MEELQTKLVDALWRVEESKAREIQLGEQLKAAKADTESYRKWSEQSQEELRLEKNANKEATSVNGGHPLLIGGKISSAKTSHRGPPGDKRGQDMLQSCKLEIDHLQHKLDRCEHQH